MKKHLTLITGASRGLGLAMAQQLSEEGHRVVSLARQTSPFLPSAVEQWRCDLADTTNVAQQLHDWLVLQDPATLASLTLINNAGVVATPSPLRAGNAAELSNAMRVGVEAPLLLTAAFLRATATWWVPRKVLLISSGLGRSAMAGSVSYCAAKAGMDHLARALALEEAAIENGARVVSLAPGVIDTDMQVQLRAADASLFPERARFASLKEGGLLDSPATAAAKVIGYLKRADFGAKAVADVRDE